MPFENWEEDHKLRPTTMIVIALVAMLAIAGTAYAIYKITSPPSAPVVVTTPATLTAPTTNSTSATVGAVLQLTTQLSDNAPGLQVFFYHNGSSSAIGSAYTGSTGQAIFNYPLTQTGTFVFHAECTHP